MRYRVNLISPQVVRRVTDALARGGGSAVVDDCAVTFDQAGFDWLLSRRDPDIYVHNLIDMWVLRHDNAGTPVRAIADDQAAA